MSRVDTQKVRTWLVSKYTNIGSNEIDALLSELEARGMAAEPKIIDRILRRRFPEAFKEKEMSTGRIVPPLESRAAQPTPPQQTALELEEIMKAYVRTNHWQTLAPNSAPPWAFNNGVMYVGSRSNLALIKSKLREMGVRRIRVTDIQEAVNALALTGVFERVVEQPVAPPPPPPPPPPSPQELARQAHNKQVRIERAMNDFSTSPIKGGKEKPQPLLKPTTNTNVAEAESSAKAAAENAIINTAISRIDMFQGASHSRTFSGRAHLRAVFQEKMGAGQSAEAVLAAVEAEADKLVDSGSIR